MYNWINIPLGLQTLREIISFYFFYIFNKSTIIVMRDSFKFCINYSFFVFSKCQRESRLISTNN